MSENQNNETLCDFIREIRSQADEIAKHLGDQHTFVEQKKQLADRLDQIRMRMEIEQAKLRGNSAALREALEKIDAMETPHNFQIERSDIADACYDLTRAIKLAHAALAAPQRNCDKYATAEEAWDAYDDWKDSFVSKGQTPPLNEWGWMFATNPQECK